MNPYWLLLIVPLSMSCGAALFLGYILFCCPDITLTDEDWH